MMKFLKPMALTGLVSLASLASSAQAAYHTKIKCHCNMPVTQPPTVVKTTIVYGTVISRPKAGRAGKTTITRTRLSPVQSASTTVRSYCPPMRSHRVKQQAKPRYLMAYQHTSEPSFIW